MALTSRLGTHALGHDSDAEWSPDLDEDDQRELREAEQDPGKFVSRFPRQGNLLGYFSCVCLILNRMIGTGIFNSSSVVFTNTQSIGVSVVLWFLGAIMALAGVIVYIELGLSIPRWPYGSNGEKISTPRNGEGLIYFNYMLKQPLFFATCMFGITFIMLEHTSSNSISFAQNILSATNMTQTPGRIIGISFSANTFACLLHSISRKWGIRLNNFLGTIKFFILLFIIIIGLVWFNHDVASTNYDIKTSFTSTSLTPHAPYKYAEAFTFIILPYGAFHQINYIISEVKEPRKTFPRAAFYGVLTVATLYTGVILIYAAIVPKATLFTPGGVDVGAYFFKATLGKITTNAKAQAIYSSFKAISALGSIIVVTFTTARVKQEIAKEGILPFSLVFAKSYDFSLGRLLGRHRQSKTTSDQSMMAEKTPAAALALHWFITNFTVLISIYSVQPKPYSGTPAQSFVAQMFIYDIDIVQFVFISFGLLCLHFTPRVRWAEKSEFKYPTVSVICASILFAGSLFPFVCLWVFDPKSKWLARSNNTVSWIAGQTGGVTLLAFAFAYWVAFRAYVSIRAAREGKMLHLRREPKFRHDSHGLTQVLEIVTLEWKRDVGLRLDVIKEVDEKAEAKAGKKIREKIVEKEVVVSPVSSELPMMRSLPSPIEERVWDSGIGLRSLAGLTRRQPQEVHEMEVPHRSHELDVKKS